MNKFFLFVIFFSFCCFCYTLVNYNHEYSLIYLLPFSLFAFSILFSNLYHDYSSSWVFKIFILQSLVRYPLMAFVYCYDANRQYNNLYYPNIAIVIMVLELMACFVVLFFFSKIQYISFKTKKDLLTVSDNYFVVFIILMLMFVLILIDGAFKDINLIYSMQDYVDQHVSGEIKGDVSLGGLLFNAFKALIALTLITYIFKSKSNENVKSVYYFLIILISSVFIMGLSRFSMVQFSLPLLILITYLVSEKKAKIIEKYSLIVILIALFFASIGKYSRYGSEANIDVLFNKYMLNAYFSGPDNINVGVSLFETKYYINNFYYFFNDTLQNIPILSKITIDEFKLNLDYNEYIYGHRYYADQIVPLSSSGLFHFGYMGVFFYSCIFLTVALFFERRSHKSYDLYYKFIYICLSLSFSYVFMKNMSGFYSNLIGIVLFILLPLCLVNMLKFIKVKI